MLDRSLFAAEPSTDKIGPKPAAVAVGRRWGELGAEVEVGLPGGQLVVSWPGPGSPLWQTGATSAVYEGYIEL